MLNKLYKPRCRCRGTRLGEDDTALRTVAVTDPTFSTRKGLPESGEGGGGGGGTPLSGSVPLALRHLRTGFHFTFHLLFTAAKSLRAKKNRARGVWGARGGVCAAAWLCEQGCEELLGICRPAHPSGNIYLFINLFYEDRTGYRVQFLTHQSLLGGYKPWLGGQCNTTVRLPLLDLVLCSRVPGERP